MKVAISDYDGTLHICGEVETETLSAIRDWRGAGNIFGIASGRDLSMLIHETDKWGIEFDFLVCAGGAVIYDHDLTVLKSTALADTVVPQILKHAAAATTLHFELCAQGRVYLYINREDSWFPGLGTPYTQVTRAEALALQGLQMIGFAYPEARESELCARQLNDAFGDALHAHQNGVCIDITHLGVDKAAAIQDLLAIKGWSDQNVITIGDGRNDLPMIRCFHGCTVTGAEEAIKRESSAVYAHVGDMLRANMA